MNAKSEYLLELGNRIRNERVSLGLSQDELAQKCGYTSRASINKIELGYVDLPLSKVRILAEVLGVSILYIIDGDITDTSQIDREEEKIIKSYRTADNITREMVQRILGIDEKEKIGNISSAWSTGVSLKENKYIFSLLF